MNDYCAFTIQNNQKNNHHKIDRHRIGLREDLINILTINISNQLNKDKLLLQIEHKASSIDDIFCRVDLAK